MVVVKIEVEVTVKGIDIKLKKQIKIISTWLDLFN